MARKENFDFQISDPSKALQTEINIEAQRQERLSKLKRAMFLASITGMSALVGFGFTVALAKRKDPTTFTKSLIGSRDLPESGTSLALRALAWGTFYSVSGVSLLCFGVYKLSGAESMKDFTRKIQSIMPKVPKKPQEQQGKSDFKTVRELVNYLIDEDEKNKKEGKKT
ncbi:transmembrane protein 242-like [Lineus longissimus]|uniref:transmembrane protein 242-like n=1 Tax=Lineus longissimus TaxID=88925 RepID=UPI002B4CB90B